MREYLKSNHATVLHCFADLEKVEDSTLSDIRLARKAGGFAFEYWCAGGDLQDIHQLLEHFSSMLGSQRFEGDPKVNDTAVRTRVGGQITQNVESLAGWGETDVWKLSMEARRQLLQSWREQIDPQTIVDRTTEIHRGHQAALSRKHQARADIDLRCLGQQDIIGSTITACAMHWNTLKQLGPQIVICEEAGEIMEAQSLCTLFPTVQHVISIGDPLQLRPQVNQQALSLETNLGASYRLDESLMERMMYPTMQGVRPISSSHLNIQRRMHPEIAEIMRATLYPYLLVCYLMSQS